jgi:hypothetical protein
LLQATFEEIVCFLSVQPDEAGRLTVRLFMTRPMIVLGVLAVGFGVAVIIPALPEYLSRGFFSGLAAMVVALGVLLIVAGGATGLVAFRRSRDEAMPAPVRATVMATILFLSFCALEFSDGLLRQDGRIFYWTSVVFLPALGLLYGLVSAHRWAWRVARIVAAFAILWFAGFIVLIPFVDLRTDGVPVPWQGRLYMAGVSLFFASTAAYAFRSLGRAEAKQYFGKDIRLHVAEKQSKDQ